MNHIIQWNESIETNTFTKGTMLKCIKYNGKKKVKKILIDECF